MPLSDARTWELEESEIEALTERTLVPRELEEAGMRRGEKGREGFGAEERTGNMRWGEREMRWREWCMVANCPPAAAAEGIR